MDLTARIDLELPRQPSSGRARFERGTDYIALPPSKATRRVDVRQAGRTFCTAPPNDPDALLEWVRAYAMPTTANAVSTAWLDQQRANLVYVGEKADDAALAEEFDPIGPEALDRKGLWIEFVGKRLDEVDAHCQTRLAFRNEQLVLQPADLMSAMWLWVCRRIMGGRRDTPCRNAKCTKMIERAHDPDHSWWQHYCDRACQMHIQRHPEDDRYPQLVGMSRGEANKEMVRIIQGSLR